MTKLGEMTVPVVYMGRDGFGWGSVALTETFCYLELCSTCLKESLGRSKPATNLSTSTLTHHVGFLLYPSLTEPSSIE
jgi:hypothetical protein